MADWLPVLAPSPSWSPEKASSFSRGVDRSITQEPIKKRHFLAPLPPQRKDGRRERLIPFALAQVLPMDSVLVKSAAIPFPQKWATLNGCILPGFCKQGCTTPAIRSLSPFLCHIFSKKTGRTKVSPVTVKVPGFIKWDLLFSKLRISFQTHGKAPNQPNRNSFATPGGFHGRR